MSRTWWGARPIQLVPTRANGQPAFGYYLQDPHAAVERANGLIVLTLAGDKICAITRFGRTACSPTSACRGPCNGVKRPQRRLANVAATILVVLARTTGAR